MPGDRTARTRVNEPTLYVMVGLPGAGKTVRARQLEEEVGALRLTPDEWMIPLFGESDADGKRDVLEGRFVWLAMRALRLGVNVILDFGVWSREERSALRALAAASGAGCELVYLPIGPDEQRQRVANRRTDAPESTFEVDEAELDQFRSIFSEPDRAELSATALDPPPHGYATWASWAARRWPSSG